jgi:hypothetical protein
MRYSTVITNTQFVAQHAPELVDLRRHVVGGAEARTPMSNPNKTEVRHLHPRSTDAVRVRFKSGDENVLTLHVSVAQVQGVPVQVFQCTGNLHMGRKLYAWRTCEFLALSWTAEVQTVGNGVGYTASTTAMQCSRPLGITPGKLFNSS